MDRLKLHSVFYLAGKIAVAGLSLLTIVLFIRLAGKAEYGRYSLLLSAILLSVLLGAGWICQIILRFRSQCAQGASREQFRSAILFLVLISMALGSLVFGVILQRTGFASWPQLIACILLFQLAFAYNLLLTYAQSNFQAGRYVLSEVARGALTLIIPLLLYMINKRLDSSLLLGSLLAAYGTLMLGLGAHRGFAWLRVRRQGPSGLPPWWNWTPQLTEALKIYSSFGIPVGLWLAAAYSVKILDRYFIAYFADYEKAGVYSGLYDIVAGAFSMLYAPILIAAHPLIMNLDSREPGESSRIRRKAIRYEILLLPAMLLGLGVLAPVLAQTLKISLSVTFNLMIPLGVGSFFWCLSMLVHKPMELGNQTWMMLLFMAIALTVNALGNWVFIPRYGYTAAAYATMTSAGIYLLLAGLWSRRLGASND